MQLDEASLPAFGESNLPWDLSSSSVLTSGNDVPVRKAAVSLPHCASVCYCLRLVAGEQRMHGVVIVVDVALSLLFLLVAQRWKQSC